MKNLPEFENRIEKQLKRIVSLLILLIVVLAGILFTLNAKNSNAYWDEPLKVDIVKISGNYIYSTLPVSIKE